MFENLEELILWLENPLITPEQFHTLFPKAEHPEHWAAALIKELPKIGVTAPEQVAMFLAQTGHETTGYTALTENLNYSVVGLRTYFRPYFTEAEAKAYERQPERIANRAYANRYGNGPEASGDGWHYRGRGAIHCTFKANYAEYSRWRYGDDRAVLDPNLLTQPEDAVGSAVWFWQLRKIQTVDSIERATKLVNGGANGLKERTALYSKAIVLLK